MSDDHEPIPYIDEPIRTVAGFVTVSQQLLDDLAPPIIPATESGGVFIPPMWLTGEYEAMLRPTPEQLAERAARQAEHDRRRAEWWASLSRRQRLRIRSKRQLARARSQISSKRTDLAYLIAPWLERDPWDD